MTINLQRFRIEGLHGKKTFDIPIRDNKLILVGENGSSKSTVANFIYFFLSRQWHRMTPYEFRNVTIQINDKEFTIEREEMLLLPTDPERRNYRLSKNLSIEIRRMMAGFDLQELLNNRELLLSIREELGVPTSIIINYIEELIQDDSPLFTQRIRQVSQNIRELLKEQILYLPTYRRIEKELRSIRPELASEREVSQKNRFSLRNKQHYVELVEFGMEDVEQNIEYTLQKLKDALRTGLNELTGTYLRDVIKNEYDRIKIDLLASLDEADIDAVLDRVGENLLSANEKLRLKQLTASIKTHNTKFKDRDKVILHFLIKLVELHRRQQENEKSVQEFIKISNSYLKNKDFIYDSSEFSIKIYEMQNEKRDTQIKMSMLSSGEKQIVSLFAHVYLSDRPGFFVIIDEPELSLSVPWQRKFLPDILLTGKCHGLIAVTHSPFIFENGLDDYTFDIERYMDAK